MTTFATRSHLARRALVLTAALACFGPGSAPAQFEILNESFDSRNRTEVRVTSPFEMTPHRGFVPVTISAKNLLNRPMVWVFTFSAHTEWSPNDGLRTSMTHTISLPAGDRTEQRLLIPVPTQLNRNQDSVLQLSVRSLNQSYTGQLRPHRHGAWTSVGWSRGLRAANDLDAFSNKIHSTTGQVHRNESVGIAFFPEQFGTDWREFSGFDTLLMTQREFRRLEPGQRQALTSWVRFGGHLHLFGDRPGGPDDPGKEDLGFGKIEHHPANGATFNQQDLSHALNHQTPRHLSRLREDYSRDWGLQRLFGSKDFNPWLVFVILVAFAICVGPVNLFILAKPGLRHRLFITTPLISFAASLILMGIIIFQDGFGGTGRRAAVLLLESSPDERLAYLVQEQIARTGVLLGRSFDPAEPGYLTPLTMDDSRWTYIDDRGNISGGFRLDGTRWTGDWFRSRSEQAHLATFLRPSRARLEWTNAGSGEPPKLVSNLDFTLEELHFIDPDGAVWKASAPIRPGDTAQLESSAEAAFRVWYQNAAEPYSKTLRQQVREMADRPGHFLALASEPGEHLVSTLPSIRWKGDQLLVIGAPLVPGTSS